MARLTTSTTMVVGKPNMADNSFFEIIKAALPYNFLFLFEKKNMGISPGKFTIFFCWAASVCPGIFHLLFISLALWALRPQQVLVSAHSFYRHFQKEADPGYSELPLFPD